MLTHRNTPWFALAVTRRRLDLGLSHSDIPARGGPSAPTMAKIDTGAGTLADTVLARLELALHWQPGTTARALGPDMRSLHDVLGVLGHDDHQSPPVEDPYRLLDTHWTPASGARPQARAVRTRAALIGAGAREFTRCGYAGASIDTILTEAACTKGAMYFHFDSKAELADAVLTAAEQLYIDIAERWRTAESAHPLDAIACLVDDITAAYPAHAVLQAETPLALAEPRVRTRRPSSAWESAVHSLADAADAAGYLQPRYDADALTRAITAAVAGHRYLHHTTGISTTDACTNSTDGGNASVGGNIGSPTGCRGDELTLEERTTESLDIIYTAMATPHYLHPTTTTAHATCCL